MTNEQKAREIAKEYSRPYGFGLNNDSSIECYQSALQAMQWKDKREIEFLQTLLFQSATQNIFVRINNRIKLLKGE